MIYNESLYYCNCCMLEQISYIGKFWFLRYGPKCSWPTRLWDFSINLRTLKLAVSHEEINGINWFLVCPSNGFLRSGWLGFSDFWHSGRKFQYWKTDRALSSKKIHFCPNLGKKDPEWPQNRLFWSFLKNLVMLVLIGNSLKSKLILSLMFD